MQLLDGFYGLLGLLSALAEHVRCATEPVPENQAARVRLIAAQDTASIADTSATAPGTVI